MKPFYSNPKIDLYQADAREIPLPGQSVHCVVTSPPYFGLRKYKAEGKVIGLEQTMEEYLEAMMEVFDEVYRVLRDDGICWVNLGDSYGGSGKGQNADGTHNPKTGDKQHTNTGSTLGGLDTRRGTLTGGLPANVNHSQEDGRAWSGESGQLLNIPHRFALRMQERGWIHRDTIIWWKKSPMPESLGSTRWERCRVKVGGGWTNGRAFEDGKGYSGHGDTIMDQPQTQWADCPGCAKCDPNGGLVLRRGSWRCTDSYEVIFMFVKKMGYFCDGQAVKVPQSQTSFDRWTRKDGSVISRNYDRQQNEYFQARDGNKHIDQMGAYNINPDGRANRRNVWSDIKPEPFGGQHYATFPSDLPRICIQASTSEAGVCSQCGAQWARVVDRGDYHEDPQREGRSVRNVGNTDMGIDGYSENGGTLGLVAETRTLDWRPTCTCNAPTVPATVLDPFCGTGTTCLAAMRLGRRSVGVDLSSDYLSMAIKRLESEPLPLAKLF